MIFEWIEAQRSWFQWVPLGLLVLGTVLQGLLTLADQQQAQQDSQRVQASLERITTKLERLSHVEGIERYLQPIKVESLKKYVRDQELRRLEGLLLKFSASLRSKDPSAMKSAVDDILNLIPTDPFFRVHRLLLDGRLIQDLFTGKYRVVQVVRWDWRVEGDEQVALYVMTGENTEQPVTYGPFTNNVISMLDGPIQRYVQIRVKSHGTGHFEWYPRSFRIGWAVAERLEDGNWSPMPGLAEYDPFFTIGLHGNLEW